jgi:cyclase
MKQISKNVYYESWPRTCNTGFLVTRNGVVMIDTPESPSDAIKWRDEIAKYGPVRYLINTEPHGDHVNGNFFFEGTVIAHEGTRKAMLRSPVKAVSDRMKRDNPGIVLPDTFQLRVPEITLYDRLDIHLEDFTLELINFPGHTPFEVAVFIPEEKVIFTSDNVCCRVQSFLREALPFEWLKSLKAIEQLEADVVVPGHGEICDRTYIHEMSAFIQDWIDAVKSAIDRGMSLQEAQSKISFLDRYPMQKGTEHMAQDVQRMNVARLYTLLTQ